MKKKRKTLLWIIFGALFIVAAACVWNWDNINVLIKTFSSSSEQIAKEMNEKKEKLEQELKLKSPTVISDLSAEEEKMIIKGHMSVDEAIKNLKERYESSKTDKSGSDANGDIDRLIAEKIVELYSLKAYYLGQIGQMESVVKKDYIALPKEKRNVLGKKEIIDKHMGTALGLLKKCDEQVEEILSELKSGLQEYGADTSVIKTIREAYENEKNLKKAYYIKLMEE